MILTYHFAKRLGAIFSIEHKIRSHGAILAQNDEVFQLWYNESIMLKLYNTLSRKKESIKSKPGKKLRLFVCGPTVYDYSHLGHARTYIAFDAFVTFLRSQGYRVDYLQNITDIDDKIIRRAKEKNLPPKSIARMFEKEYLKDMKSLGISSVNKYARATDHIPEIISQIKRLLKKKYAYEVEGDGIYYDISRFKEYGKLSRRTTLQAEDAVSRIDESIKKRNKGDFALWKLAQHRTTVSGAGFSEPSWNSPWGKGRPGWHIEDTAITEKRFGAQYELHGGAKDLIFPHHEAEIAQMEAISGKKPMARHWMHTGFLTVNKGKMSKSLGNFVTVQNFLDAHSPRILRLLVLKAHYRSPIDYSENLLLQIEQELQRIDEFINKIRNPKSEIRNKPEFQISKFKTQFKAALEDDFNTPKAIAVVFDIITKGNILLAKGNLSKTDSKTILNFLKEVDEIFGFIFSKEKKTVIPLNILNLLDEREKYRKEAQWQKADTIRKKLLGQGWQIDDTSQGPKLKRI
ncbi:MAG: cysteine--tRNA ligase [bacterium]|nr:cysteine--tRNA ligase [bacterium]